MTYKERKRAQIQIMKDVNLYRAFIFLDIGQKVISQF